VLAEFWLDGMAARGVTPADVLASYRAARRPLLLLEDGGRAGPATDEAIVAACEARPGRFVNVVLDALAA